MKRPPQKYDLVLVTWDDAAALKHGWIGADVGEPEPQVVMSVGFLVKDTENYVVIAMDIDPDGLHNTRGQIPKGMLRSMKVLRKADRVISAKPEILQQIQSDVGA